MIKKTRTHTGVEDMPWEEAGVVVDEHLVPPLPVGLVGGRSSHHGRLAPGCHLGDSRCRPLACAPRAFRTPSVSSCERGAHPYEDQRCR